jgi:hypothetical protein
MILNKGAKDNRTSKFERKVTVFLSFLGSSRKLSELRFHVIHPKKGLEETNPTV